MKNDRINVNIATYTLKSTIYGKSLIFYLNNKYFTLLENGSVYGTGNNSNNHR